MRRKSILRASIPVAIAIAAGVALTAGGTVEIAQAQHTSGGHSGGRGGGHSASDHVDHDSGHTGQRGAGRGGRHGDGQGEDHGGGGVGHADLEDQVFRRGAAGRGGGMEDSILRQGGRPVWAGGAVPEDLELGRLNVARAPGSMRAHALEEVYSTNLDKDSDGQIDEDANLDEVESPVANLALYEEALKQGRWSTSQAAMFLGRASDKTIPIGSETVEAVNLILGVPENHAGIEAFTYQRSDVYAPAILEAVFDGAAWSGSGLEGFAQAADDERAVTLFLHDHPEALPGF